MKYKFKKEGEEIKITINAAYSLISQAMYIFKSFSLNP